MVWEILDFAFSNKFTFCLVKYTCCGICCLPEDLEENESEFLD